MPRLTAAQVSYGSATVVLSALAMLLLSRTDSGAGVAVIGTASLLLGLLVSMTVPLRRRTKAARTPAAPAAARAHHPAADTRITAARAERAGEHSLRR
ncbi:MULTISPECIES: hypothetical protein [unclassified Streptomyces]|uniref:hypothetical protein n=1 Tax=unclassified Streptomyces TaxID=2593676 RepID=UPI0001C1AC5B|nr:MULTISPECIES: hypothetical protein [unclassified Streptomyces]AEN10285.1 conserved hypothetical protein [Streptomyces sp. SirexAA-E]MYR66863.1 hypothetical protein [Streptomyces sp. SID4939]MYS02018.1 hypothetical protein [Streptomyces sp. SID4940]MYT65436.1 hypothetical protein [Streptomyces sp. SID8357]MYT84491.1 hypothetical protein [Streptomyces sp. SID8360]